MFVKAACAGLSGAKVAMPTAVQMWKVLPASEQEVWNEKCRALKAEYKRCVAAKGL